MVKKDKKSRFVYRDSVWRGTDMLGTGVASFSHMSGVHFQNSASWDEYLNRIKNNELPITRAFNTSAHERMVREFILQLKLGSVNTDYFKTKHKTDIIDFFKEPLEKLQTENMLSYNPNEVRLTRQGLLRVDGLLPEFYNRRYKNARYT
jgi:oxygen-independent coproporphyrinogen-3 oxidase